MSITLPDVPAAARRAAAASAARLEVQARAADRTRVTIYGDIGGFWDNPTGDLVKEIAAITSPAIDVHLNSPGGSAFDGVAIYNVLRSHDADVTVHVEGLAASAASIIAMAGDTIEMGIGAQMMVHDASGLAYGNASEMTAMADALDSVSGSLASVYAHRAGGTTESWRDVMRAETWYTAAEAVDAGLATRVAETGEPVDAEATFDLSRFAHAGRSHAPGPHTARAAALNPLAARPGSTTTQDGGTPVPLELTDEQAASLQRLAGVPATATADLTTIIAALDEALGERAEPASTLPPGTVAVDSAVLEQMQANLAELSARDAERAVNARAQTVENAIREGRITPAAREAWVTALANDPGGHEAAALAARAPGLAANTTETGHAGEVETADPDSADAVKASATYVNWSV